MSKMGVLRAGRRGAGWARPDAGLWQLVSALLLLAIPQWALASDAPTRHDDGSHSHHAHTAPVGWREQAEAMEGLEPAFELQNAQGRTVSQADFRGRFLLVSFGFTHCAHVCPTTLADWSRMMRDLDPDQARQLQPVMISVDPERDTPAVMDTYAKNFDARFIGLSGSAEQVAETAASFRVTYQRVSRGDDYQINHTSLSYLVDPTGQVIDYFGFGTPPDRLAASVSGHLETQLR